ncbi:unnamed protein product [Amoebophrya sp. A120]|nr:unnamed protein product [Amoebophrya sp. A120]|eukprot:GSA120T00022609001.1
MVKPKLMPVDFDPEAAVSPQKFFAGLEASFGGWLMFHPEEVAPQLEIFQTFGDGKFMVDPKDGGGERPLQVIFVSHGGVGSLAEAAAFRLPLLCLPLLQGDQPPNCRQVARMATGRDLGKLSAAMILHKMLSGPIASDVTNLAGRHFAYFSTPGCKTGGEDRTGELKFEGVVAATRAELGKLQGFYESAAQFSQSVRAMKRWEEELLPEFERESGVPWRKQLDIQGVLRTEAKALLAADSAYAQGIRGALDTSQDLLYQNTVSRETGAGQLLEYFMQNEKEHGGWMVADGATEA